MYKENDKCYVILLGMSIALNNQCDFQDLCEDDNAQCTESRRSGSRDGLCLCTPNYYENSQGVCGKFLNWILPKLLINYASQELITSNCM